MMKSLNALVADTRRFFAHAFRWKNEAGDVLPNHYEMYEIVENFNNVAIIRDKGGS